MFVLASSIYHICLQQKFWFTLYIQAVYVYTSAASYDDVRGVLHLLVGNKNRTQVLELPVSMQLLDLDSILVGYTHEQNTHLHQHATPLIVIIIITEIVFSKTNTNLLNKLYYEYNFDEV